MGIIKRLEIWGYKRFKHLVVDFNEKTNIIVGENESGKSTILEAINIVLNQWYRNSDKSIIKEFLNIDNVNNFIANPSEDNLPYVRIEVELMLSEEDKYAWLYYGANKNNPSTDSYGICFECRIDDEVDDLYDEIMTGKIPFEYYILSWNTFKGFQYNLMKKPINSILVDTTTTETWSSFNYFYKSLYTSKYSEKIRDKARNSFRQKVDDVIISLELEDLDDNKRFSISSRKLILDNLLSVFDNGIPLENRGKGIENIIKTKISLDKVKNKIDTALIEEPENHLSYSTLMKMIKEIEDRSDVCQVVITTHNNMIASRLDLRNILWISDDPVKSLKDVEKQVAEYFTKVDNNNLLNMLLADRVILVEGATEYILLPKFYQQIYGTSLEKDGITIVSCNGLSHNNYLHIAEKVNKRIAVITDNDKKQSQIEFAKEYNSSHTTQHIYMSTDIEQWTWEVCIYNLNKAILDTSIHVRDGFDYKYHGNSYGKQLGKMLNNKTETAYTLLTSDIVLEIPDYIKAAMKWIKE